MTLEQFKKSDFEEIWEIMEYSFPACERRSHDGQKQLFDRPEYRIYGCRTDGKIDAFLSCWELPGFYFLEHFAVAEQSRNRGLGAQILREVLAGLDGTVVLEVEPPEGTLQKRRISFYERNGFVLNEYPYIQPELSKGAGMLPLLLMTRPGSLTDEAFEKTGRELYEKVYQTEWRQFV